MSWTSRLFAIPWVMVGGIFILVIIGTMALYSASDGTWTASVQQHLIRSALGFFLAFFIALLPIKFLFRISFIIWLGFVGILVALPLIGVGAGATRWINLGFMNFQPSEPTKIAVVLLLARYLSLRTFDQIDKLLIYIPALLIAAIPSALVLMQPDLGTGLMIFVAGLAVIFVSGLPKRYVIIGISAVAACIPIIWSQLYDYQKARLLTFLNPEKDILGAGWQITQSKIALGSGGLFGKGFLQGSQSQLDYLPEKQTDFVFTLIGEEFGFIGNSAIIFIYFLIIISITGIGLRAKNRFSSLVASGLAMVIFLYVFVNIAMVTGVLPVVGAPLPLLSYGGTALLTVFIILGISMNLSQNSQREDLEIS